MVQVRGLSALTACYSGCQIISSLRKRARVERQSCKIRWGWGGAQILMEGDKGEYSVLASPKKREGGLICISLIFMKLQTIIIKQLRSQYLLPFSATCSTKLIDIIMSINSKVLHITQYELKTLEFQCVV